MSSRAVAAARTLGLVVVVASAAACGAVPAGTPVPPVASPPAGATPGIPTVDPTPPGSAVPANPTPVPGSEPPLALIAGIAGEAVPGDLGSFAWGLTSSDSPWIVGTAGGAARPGDRLELAFMPGVAQTAWQARWAPLAGGRPGDPVDGGAGEDGPIELAAPATPGAWSLQVVARFGDGRDAAWYWRVEVAP